MSTLLDTVVVGAGPYGLSIAAHTRAAGLSTRNFGRPMSAWAEHMPAGMLLKSEVWASHLGDPLGRYGYDAYCREHNLPYEYANPIPLETFVAYGRWFAALAAEGVEQTQVVRVSALNRAGLRGGPGSSTGPVDRRARFEVELEDGEVIRTRTVVLAVGVLPFAYTPPELAALDSKVAGHAGDYPNPGDFAGKRVAVLGAGQSALETATLLAEAGALPQIVARTNRLAWNGTPLQEDRSAYRKLREPQSALGSGLRTWGLANLPGAVRHLPLERRAQLVRTTLGPAGSWWLRDRFEGKVPAILGAQLAEAYQSPEGTVRLSLLGDAFGSQEVEFDHVIAATGYRVDLDRLPILEPALRERIAFTRTRSTPAGPMLNGNFESSVQGLFFAGLPAALSFGPLMRFVAGAAFSARQVNRRLTALAREGGGVPVAGGGSSAGSSGVSGGASSAVKAADAGAADAAQAQSAATDPAKPTV
ncbi:MAG TPA: SidA/IucD/PvdA family monooxygenase [Actinocrinis sp.]|nr:SidA/IucD/PvdA family monooxygenase [Actinocrinis sp.]